MGRKEETTGACEIRGGARGWGSDMSRGGLRQIRGTLPPAVGYKPGSTTTMRCEIM